MTLFNNSFGGKLSVDAVVKEIVNFMRADIERKYRVTIGTDSEGLNGSKTEFVTAIVVHRVGNGGRYFWRRIVGEKMHTLRDRIVREVMISLDAAKEVLGTLQKATKAEGENFPKWDFEIHVDVGENGKTQTMIQEVTAMIRAMNFEAKTKPESYAASNVADRYV